MKTKQMSDLRLKKMAELAGGDRILDVGFAARPNKYLHGTVIGFDIRILQNILFSKSMFSESKGTSEYHRLFFLSSRDLIYLLNHAGFNRVKIYKGAGMNIPKTDIYITLPQRESVQS